MCKGNNIEESLLVKKAQAQLHCLHCLENVKYLYTSSYWKPDPMQYKINEQMKSRFPYLTAAVVITVPFPVGVFGVGNIVATSHYSRMALGKIRKTMQTTSQNFHYHNYKNILSTYLCIHKTYYCVTRQQDNTTLPPKT